MSFLSIEFGVIFTLFLLLYALAGSVCRGVFAQNMVLFCASYAFVYAFDWRFAVLLFSYSIALYLLSIQIVSSRHSRIWLGSALIAVIVNLGFWKYFDFFREAALALGLSLPAIEIIMPIGLSFYSFHSVSLLISLQKHEINLPNPLNFLLFLSFFPSIVAGPINRAVDFLPQLEAKESRIPLEVERAFMLIVLAIIKVLWLDGILGRFVSEPVFAQPEAHHSLDLVCGLYALSTQIYLNFSGYTDMVTAIALLLGFRLPVNFRTPYLSCNLRDFWRRWHISLSSFIRDYIYIPLGGNKGGFGITQSRLMIAMLLSGLWHGASVAFLLWGALHGIGIVLLNIGDRIFGRDALTKRQPFLARLVTFHYVTFGWILFFSPTLEEVWRFTFAMFTHWQGFSLAPMTPFWLLILAGLFLLYPVFAKLPEYYLGLLRRANFALLPLMLVLTLWLIIALAPAGIPGFIYAGF